MYGDRGVYEYVIAPADVDYHSGQEFPERTCLKSDVVKFLSIDSNPIFNECVARFNIPEKELCIMLFEMDRVNVHIILSQPSPSFVYTWEFELDLFAGVMPHDNGYIFSPVQTSDFPNVVLLSIPIAVPYARIPGHTHFKALLPSHNVNNFELKYLSYEMESINIQSDTVLNELCYLFVEEDSFDRVGDDQIISPDSAPLFHLWESESSQLLENQLSGSPGHYFAQSQLYATSSADDPGVVKVCRVGGPLDSIIAPAVSVHQSVYNHSVVVQSAIDSRGDGLAQFEGQQPLYSISNNNDNGGSYSNAQHASARVGYIFNDDQFQSNVTIGRLRKCSNVPIYIGDDLLLSSVEFFELVPAYVASVNDPQLFDSMLSKYTVSATGVHNGLVFRDAYQVTVSKASRGEGSSMYVVSAPTTPIVTPLSLSTSPVKVDFTASKLLLTAILANYELGCFTSIELHVSNLFEVELFSAALSSLSLCLFSFAFVFHAGLALMNSRAFSSHTFSQSNAPDTRSNIILVTCLLYASSMSRPTECLLLRGDNYAILELLSGWFVIQLNVSGHVFSFGYVFRFLGPLTDGCALALAPPNFAHAGLLSGWVVLQLNALYGFCPKA